MVVILAYCYDGSWPPALRFVEDGSDYDARLSKAMGNMDLDQYDARVTYEISALDKPPIVWEALARG